MVKRLRHPASGMAVRDFPIRVRLFYSCWGIRNRADGMGRFAEVTISAGSATDLRVAASPSRNRDSFASVAEARYEQAGPTVPWERGATPCPKPVIELGSGIGATGRRV